MIDEAALAKVIERLAPASDRALLWEPSLPLLVRTDELAALIAAAREREQLRVELERFGGMGTIEALRHETMLGLIDENAKLRRERDSALACSDVAHRERDEARATLEQCQAEHGFFREHMRKYAAEAKEAQAALEMEQSSSKTLRWMLDGAQQADAAAKVVFAELQAAILSQQQATQEAMRRAEETRRELVEMKHDSWSHGGNEA